MPSMVALGGSIDTDSKLATLSDERAEKYSTQAEEVLNSTRFDSDEFHQYTSRLVSAAQYEPAGRAWLVSSFCVPTRHATGAIIGDDREDDERDAGGRDNAHSSDARARHRRAQ